MMHNKVKESQGTSVCTSKLAAESRYHNPAPLIWLLDHANEARVVVEGVEMMALVDTGVPNLCPH